MCWEKLIMITVSNDGKIGRWKIMIDGHNSVHKKK